jgi:aryl-alcohol dehydrogenase-like predicted oxidoreductase
MEYRFLGRSALKVSELCFGVMTFGDSDKWDNVGSVGVKEAERQMGIAMDAGVNFFDTADIYHEGRSEEILGKALGPRRRDVILTTKVGFKVGDKPNDVGLSRHRIMEGCEQSLRRLGTDYIDLYQVHCYDPVTHQDETLRALDDLVRQGKVRYIGCSNFTGWQLMKALSISERQGLERYVSHQARYNLVSRGLEYELVPLSLDHDIGILPWSPLEGGFLTGKFRKGAKRPRKTRLEDPDQQLPFDVELGYRIVDALGSIAETRDASVAQAALNWLRRKPAVTSIVFGARTEEQLLDNLACVTWDLSDDEFDLLDEMSTPADVYPYWFIRDLRRDRLTRSI